MDLYRLENVTRRFGGRTALDIPRLGIAEYSVTALLGPNGAGKSTLLDILAFLSPPDSGEIVWRGSRQPLTRQNLASLRREVVLVDQHPVLFSSGVFANVAFGLKTRAIPRAEHHRRVEEALDLVGMRSFIDRTGSKLSGGETQRLAIARALACRPSVLLFDEPTANIDAENQIAIESIIRDIAAERKTTIIFSTHNVMQAARLADERLFLLEGRPAASAYENLFRGEIRHENSRALFTINHSLSVPAPDAPPGAARAALNPRRAFIIPGDSPIPEGTFCSPGRLLQLAAEGRELRILVDVGVTLSLLAPAGTPTPAVGENVTVCFQDDCLTLF